MNRNQQNLNSNSNLPVAVPDFESTLNKVNYLFTSLLEMLESPVEVYNESILDGAVLLKHDLMQDLEAIFEESLYQVPKVVPCPDETKVFFKTMDLLLADGITLDHGNEEAEILVHMPTALPEISAAAGRNFNNNVLYFQLKKSDRFIQQRSLKSSSVTNKPVHTWVFKKTVAPGITGKDQFTGADTIKPGGNE